MLASVHRLRRGSSPFLPLNSAMGTHGKVPCNIPCNKTRLLFSFNPWPCLNPFLRRGSSPFLPLNSTMGTHGKVPCNIPCNKTRLLFSFNPWPCLNPFHISKSTRHFCIGDPGDPFPSAQHAATTFFPPATPVGLACAFPCCCCCEGDCWREAAARGGPQGKAGRGLGAALLFTHTSSCPKTLISVSIHLDHSTPSK
eukprot:1156461-Pelagomonas_calceolata.AAC.1